MSNRLEGKVAAITGAASGFGAAATLRFIEEGGKSHFGRYSRRCGASTRGFIGQCRSILSL